MTKENILEYISIAMIVLLLAHPLLQVVYYEVSKNIKIQKRALK